MAENRTPPEYVLFEEGEREAFLSQLGNFSTPQRQIFQKLCNFWEPVIPQKRIDSEILGHFKPQDYARLIEKLRDEHYGLALTRQGDTRRVSAGVLLCDHESTLFYDYLLQEIFRDYLENLDAAFPTIKELNRNRVFFDSQVLVPFDGTHLSSDFFKRTCNDRVLYQYSPDGKNALAVSSGSLPLLVKVARKKIRQVLMKNDAPANIARVKHCTIKDLRVGVASNHIHYWYDLTSTVLNSRRDLEMKRVDSLDMSFFLCSNILNVYLSNEIEFARQRKINEKRRDEEMATVAEKVKSDKHLLLSQDKFNRTIKETYQGPDKEFPAFKEKFYERFTQMKDRGKLSTVVFIDKHYIHRENILPCFQGEYQLIREQLLVEYEELILDLLKKGAKNKNKALFSRTAMNEDIATRCKNKSSFFYAIYSRPRLLSESLISRDNKKNFNSLKKTLGYYFVEDKIEFKPLVDIFQLNLVRLFEQASNRLTVWRQIILRITGRYRASLEDVRRLDHPYGASKNSGSRTQGSDASAYRSGTGKRKRKSGPPPKPKEYSVREQDEAWDKFTKSLK